MLVQANERVDDGLSSVYVLVAHRAEAIVTLCSARRAGIAPDIAALGAGCQQAAGDSVRGCTGCHHIIDDRNALAAYWLVLQCGRAQRKCTL